MNLKKSFFIACIASITFSSLAYSDWCASRDGQAICKELNGKKYTYSREIVFHGEYEVDACQLTVVSNKGITLYTEFKGEYWPVNTPCSGLKIGENIQYRIEPYFDSEFRCAQVDASGNKIKVSDNSFCNL